MYKNPQIFKVNTIMQTLSKMKKNGADDETMSDEMQSPRRLAKMPGTYCAFANSVGNVYQVHI